MNETALNQTRRCNPNEGPPARSSRIVIGEKPSQRTRSGLCQVRSITGSPQHMPVSGSIANGDHIAVNSSAITTRSGICRKAATPTTSSTSRASAPSIMQTTARDARSPRALGNRSVVLLFRTSDRRAMRYINRTSGSFHWPFYPIRPGHSFWVSSHEGVTENRVTLRHK